MQTIGERLEEARKRKGISIREAAEATKIRSEYLQKFEGNSFDLNLPDIYLRGFLRSYAQYLKLNADKIVTDYNGLGLGGGRESKRDSREIFGRIEVPDSISTVPNEPPAPQQPPPAPQQPRTSQIHTAPIERPRDRGNLIRIGVVASAAVLALILLVWVIRVMTTSPTTASPTTATQPAVTNTAEAETITLIALDNVKVKVVQVNDNKVLFSGELVRGETRAIVKHGPILVTHDIGKNLQFEKNGVRFRPSVDGYGRARLE